MDSERLHLFAEANHGLVTQSAASRAGISRSGWYRHVAAGRFDLVHSGVARLRGSPPTREQAIAAAVFAAQPGAAASHRSAAFLWGVPRPMDDPIDVMLFDRRRGLHLEGVVLHHPRDQRDLTPVLKHNIKSSNVLRFLCDLGAVDEPGLPDALQYIVTNGIATPSVLLKAVHVHTRRGRHGIPALRSALAEWIIDGKPADSKLEAAMSRLLSAHGLPPAEFHALIAGFEVDFWIPGTPVVLECDGWDAHGKTRAQYERGMDRDSILVAAGFIPIHFTYWQITKQPQTVVQRIRDALARWPAALAP